MSALRLSLSQNQSAYAPGETIAGTAEWQVERCSSAEVRLCWYTQGSNAEDAEIVRTVTFADPQLHDRRQFTFTAPVEPYSFSGQLISLLWAVELVVQPRDHCERLEIVIAPEGRERMITPWNAPGLRPVSAGRPSARRILHPLEPLVRPRFRPCRPPPERPATTAEGLLLFQSSTSTAHSTALLVGLCASAAAAATYAYFAWKDGAGQFWSLSNLLAFLLPGYFLFRFIRERQRLAQPQLQLLQTSSLAALGQRLQLRWRWTGAPECERRLRVLLEGQQGLTIHDSDGASETRLPFARSLIFDSTEVEGSAEWLIPPDTMHSFQADKTRVLWTLLVDVEMERGPDWSKRSPIEIRPGPTSTGGDSIRRPILEPHGPLVPSPETAAGLGGYLGDVLT